MTVRTRLACVLSPLVFSALVAACGGKTVGGIVMEDAGTVECTTASCPCSACYTEAVAPEYCQTAWCAIARDAGPPVITEPDGGACVDIELADYDQSCAEDSDCVVIRTGAVCDGQCSCGGDSPINVSGQAQYASQTSVVSLEPCHCAEEGYTQCLSNQCVFCGPDGSNCAVTMSGPDSGVIIFPAADAGISPKDAAVACVEVDVSSYSTACTEDSDCTFIQTGEVCDGNCNCGGTPVNVSGLPQYDQAVSGIQFGECGCPDEGEPVCSGGQCFLDGIGG
jgi:hypothetical protein